MKYLYYAVSVVLSDVFLLLRFFCGKKIHFNLISLVSPLATLKTLSKKGMIIIGRKTAIRTNTELSANGGRIIIGNNCFVNRNCMIVSHESIIIGNNTTIGPNVCIYDHDHNYKKSGDKFYVSKPIVIGNNVWIGAGAIILKGSIIGDNSVIGAGTIVSDCIDSDSLVYLERKNVIRKIICE